MRFSFFITNFTKYISFSYEIINVVFALFCIITYGGISNTFVSSAPSISSSFSWSKNLNFFEKTIWMWNFIFGRVVEISFLIIEVFWVFLHLEKCLSMSLFISFKELFRKVFFVIEVYGVFLHLQKCLSMSLFKVLEKNWRTIKAPFNVYSWNANRR